MYLRRTVILWFGLKLANMYGAVLAELPPAGFRIGPEIGAVVVACLMMHALMRRNGEDLLLGNLGLPSSVVFTQIAALSPLLSFLVSLLA